MTLKRKSIVLIILIFFTLGLSIKLFIDYNRLHRSLATNFKVTEEIMRADFAIYRSITTPQVDIEDTKRIVQNTLQALKQIKEEELTQNEFSSLIDVRLTFIKVEMLLSNIKGMRLQEPLQRQLRNELMKIEKSTKVFTESVSKKIEREMAFRAKIQIAIFGVVGVGIIFLFLGTYYYFLSPVVRLSSQIQAVRDKKAENISIYKGKDELGMLSKFIADTIENLSKRFDLQQATSKILKAAQTSIDSDSFLKKTLDIILSIKWLNILQRGGISLIDETDPERLLLRAEKNYLESQKKACAKITSGKCICGRTAKEGIMIIKKCIDGEHEIQYEGITPHGHICLPIKHENRVLGVINLYIDENFIPADVEIEFLNTISLIIAETLQIKKLTEMEHIVITAIEESGDGVIIANRSGDIEYANPAIEKITGYNEDEIRGINILDNLRCWGLGENVIEDVKNGNIWSASLKSKRKDGKDYYELLSIIPVKKEGNEVLKYVSISRDITREKSLEEQLKQAQRMELIGRFAGGIAHDFNNILTAIKGYITLIKDSIKQDDPLMDYVKEISQASERAANLTRNLLTFSRKQVISPRSVNLNEIIKNVEGLLVRLIGEDIELKTILSKEDLIIMADPAQIEQVIMNLVTNARDAMPTGGIITIETSLLNIDAKYMNAHLFAKLGYHALLSISDTGIGMDEETKQRLFEPFFTTKDIGKGTGLGLSIVYSIVNQHDGTIEVYSEPHKGTNFKIYFPLTNVIAEKLSSNTPAIPIGGTETILLAEDDSAVREMIKNILTKQGYTVIEAVDGKDAINAFVENKGKINILLFDIIMPKINGIDAYNEITKIKPGIKAVFMSGYADNILSREMIKKQGIDLIAKPSSPDEILRNIRKVLDR